VHHAIDHREGVTSGVDDEASRWEFAEQSFNRPAAADDLSNKTEVAGDRLQDFPENDAAPVFPTVSGEDRVHLGI